ncbi:MAG TPA: electron transport complex subunit RsxB [Rubrivivax sp.]|nr:electron transport complex subunit RsxB [Rubrivivax sp.]
MNAPPQLPVPNDARTEALADALDAALPQTQCTRCGFPDCRSYAQAMAAGEAAINRCPPGGAEGITRLAALAGVPPLQLDTSRGREAPRALAVIDEAWCIGCTLCIKACPVDCIIGASKLMHTVVEPLCTGCELCVPVCPVDCIEMRPTTAPHTGWAAWSPAQARQARQRYDFHRFRLQRELRENDERLAEKAQAKLADLAQHSRHTDPAVLDAKRAVIEAALQRARAKRQTGPDRDA